MPGPLDDLAHLDRPPDKPPPPRPSTLRVPALAVHTLSALCLGAASPVWGNTTQPPSATAAGQRASEDLLLDVVVNGQPLDDVVRVELLADKTLLIPTDAWAAARLLPLAQTRSMSDGSVAYALNAITGASYEIDRKNLSLKITVPARALSGASRASQEENVVPPPQQRQPGLVLNYGVSLDSAGNGAPVAKGVLLEAMAFSRFGNLITSAVLRDETTGRRVERLDTFWRYDMPGPMQTLVVGDTVGSGGGWSRPVRFCGIRWGRDFSMHPGFVTLPQLSVAGEAALPSTVDLLVNNARRLSQPVAPGPFELTNVPVVTGAGEISMVVRDLLGRETVVTQSYYESPELLARGLTDFSVEAGRMRFGYGQDSHYRDAFAAATFRAGITDSLTGEARVEVQPARRAAGVELAGLLGTWGAGRVALAVSRGSAADAAEQGQMLQVGIERSTQQHGGGALQYEHSSRGFAPFGEQGAAGAAALRPRATMLASVGGPLFGRVGGGASLVRQTRWDGDRVTLAGLSLTLPIARRASVIIGLNKRLDGDRAWRGGLSLSLPLADGVYAGSDVEHASESPSAATLSAAHPAPAGPGFGWRVETSTRDTQRARGALQYNSDTAEWTAELARGGSGALAARAGARGSLGLLGGLPFASRPIGQGSFAVVEVEGLAGVPVKRSHQVVATTNASGMAFVPGLLPWQSNRIEIDPDDLPLDATVATTVQAVIPYAGSGALVKFGVRRSRQALLVLQQADGQPVPVGARVRLLPDGPEFLAGRRGEIWLTDLAAGRQRIRASWIGGGCELELAPASADGAPDKIGPLACGRNAR